MGKYALIGEKLSHSMSPEIHGRILDKIGIEGTYELIEIEKDFFEHDVKRLAASGLDGFNVTIPYKNAIIPLLHELSPEAEAIGAVNTVKVEDGKMKGFNTDIYGFGKMAGLGKLEIDSGTRALVIGTGGAAKTAAYWLRQRTGRVWFLSRAGREAMKKLGSFQVIESKDEIAIGKMDLIVNCSPCGMFPEVDGNPIDACLVQKASMAIDLVYNPMRSIFLQQMEKKGCRTVGGLSMLVAQACRAQEIWNGMNINEEVEKGLMESFFNENMNPVLVGMPGSGKSSAGRLLAELMGREFIDIDELIEKESGPITEIFKTGGEKGFRKLERETVRSLRNRRNIVIATGGGTVLDMRNVADLKLNGILIYLNRSLESIKNSLEDGGRPLLKNEEDLRKLYEERAWIYSQTADFTAPDEGNADLQALKIRDMLKKIF
ncbi:MAG TPA: shikimate dehydrogenase [Clostridia bacterium]|nr:shikimate dehydrogenase [Clostridia bacterium]